ncbi:MAG: alpha-L-glutamate ligase-like protein [Oligoflexus sp.]
MIFRDIKKAGVLGMNRRIGEYILALNPRSLFPLVDDKIKTFELAQKHDMPVPHNYLVIDRYGDLKHLKERLQGSDAFAIKPARGAMGNGVLIVHKIDWGNGSKGSIKFVTSSGEKDLQTIQYHISGILSGLYSLNGMSDRAIIQEKLRNLPLFEAISGNGIPDIRVIICKGFPVMAMIRLPTTSSRGRANLHQGAVGCGIRIGEGKVSHAVHRNRIITDHPDTAYPLKDLEVPFWDRVLEISAKCYDITGLGYLGIDIVLDPVKGPLLLEMNARPGLSIQIANLAGLVPRLEKVNAVSGKLSPEERIAFAKEAF